MVLTGVNLLDDTADARTIIPNYHDEVFSDESHFLTRYHDFYMGESLLVCAYFILALYDKNATVSQDAIRFFRPIVV